MKDRIAISFHGALRTMYNAGFDSEKLLKLAHERLMNVDQPSEGYVYPDDVDALIKRLKAEYQ